MRGEKSRMNCVRPYENFVPDYFESIPGNGSVLQKVTY
jgi:hypothetical protein